MRKALLVAAIAILTTTGAASAYDRKALDDQMERVVQLEALDAACASEHDIDYDRLRDKIEEERNKALAMTASEREQRLAYSYALSIFALKHPEPVFFCEEMYREAKSNPGFRSLRPLFRDLGY